MGHPIRDRIEIELTRLGEQKRHYLVAIAVAEQSSTLRRHIRSVQRLDEEISARKEALRGLGPDSVAIELDPGDVVVVDDSSNTRIYMGSTG